MKSSRESFGWSACRGLGWRPGPWLLGALARWHIWMWAIWWSKNGSACRHQTDLELFLSLGTRLKQVCRLEGKHFCFASKLHCADLFFSFSPSLHPCHFFFTRPHSLSVSQSSWYTQLFFAFCCIIQSAAHSRSQLGVVAVGLPVRFEYVLYAVMPLFKNSCSCVYLCTKSIATGGAIFVFKHCKCFS